MNLNRGVFRFLGLLLSGVVGAALVAPDLANAANKEKNTESISAMHAFSYFAGSGRFGSLDLLDPSRALWNTPIGGGDAEGPSQATLVLVDVSGPAIDREPSGNLELIVRTKSRSFSRQYVELAQFHVREKKMTVPFLVYGSGCEPLMLEVRLFGVRGGGSSTFAREIPFQCGE